jgi:hypothetical protein
MGIGIDRLTGVISLHLISALLITINFRATAIPLLEGKTKGPHA